MEKSQMIKIGIAAGLLLGSVVLIGMYLMKSSGSAAPTVDPSTGDEIPSLPAAP